MNIRTVTTFCDPGFPVSSDVVAEAGEAAGAVKRALVEAGYNVQTTRLATPPFPDVLAGQAGKAVAYAQALEDACFVQAIDYASVGPARPADAPEFFEVVPDLLGATQNVFASAVIASAKDGVSVTAIRRTGEIIRRNAVLAPDGFGNLRFAALANVLPGAPFLPAAYHVAGAPTLAIGVEAADLAVTACAEAASLAEARARLIKLIEVEAQKITEVTRKAAGKMAFAGIDFSLAVYPSTARSLGAALEQLTGGHVGEHGTLAAAAFLADTLDAAVRGAQFKRAGFCGLFLPVLEDAVLAARVAEGTLTVTDLLLYAAVCGTGLDTIPLPGDISAQALSALLLDVAALALRLNKPLTARLMPIPDKQAGDEVTFNFEFFAPSRVMNARATGVTGLVGITGGFELVPRGS